MKQSSILLGMIGISLLILLAAGAYAYSTDHAGMMGNNQGAIKGMMNTGGSTDYRNMMNSNSGNYSGMMGNLDKNTIKQMNDLHDRMIKNLDPETAQQMDAMHDACTGNSDD